MLRWSPRLLGAHSSSWAGDRKRSIRTYSPGSVDGRFLGTSPPFCDDVAELAAHSNEGKGYFVVPVTVAKRLATPDQVFATPDESRPRPTVKMESSADGRGLPKT